MKRRKRLAALILVVLMMSLLTLNVSAASVNVKPKAGVRNTTVLIATPYQYRWFWQARKTMTVSVKNTGARDIYLYMDPLSKDCEYKSFNWAGTGVSRGQTKTIVLPYDSCTYKLTVSSSTVNNNRGFTVTTSAGNISVS